MRIFGCTDKWAPGVFTRLLVLSAMVAVFCPGCAHMAMRASEPMMDDMAKAIMKQNDPDLLKKALPAYMVMIDAVVQQAPNHLKTLETAAEMYSSYVLGFVDDPESEEARRLSAKGLDYAIRALSIKNKAFAKLYDKPADAFMPAVATMKKGDERAMMLVINAWAGYIRARPGDWEAIANLGKVQALAQRLIEIDETHFYGTAHLVLGAMKARVPAALGGDQKAAQAHFERALEISDNHFFQAYVMYAEMYARIVFDRELHDRLLAYVLDTPADVVPELTLANTLAKKRAKDLMDSADEYF